MDQTIIKEDLNKKVMKYLSLTLFSIIFLISFVPAVTIYSGESYDLNLTKQFEYYSIVGNSTECDIEVTQNSDNVVTIIPNKYSPDDSFEIIFFDIEKEIIVEYYSSGGGGGGSSSGGGSRVVYRNRNVTEYVDKEVAGDTITQDVVVHKTRWWVWGIIIILLGVVGYFSYLYWFEGDED